MKPLPSGRPLSPLPPVLLVLPVSPLAATAARLTAGAPA